MRDNDLSPVREFSRDSAEAESEMKDRMSRKVTEGFLRSQKGRIDHLSGRCICGGLKIDRVTKFVMKTRTIRVESLDLLIVELLHDIVKFGA
jgi:hypothetical protein